jgi:hypothetical protein
MDITPGCSTLGIRTTLVPVSDLVTSDREGGLAHLTETR